MGNLNTSNLKLSKVLLDRVPSGKVGSRLYTARIVISPRSRLKTELVVLYGIRYFVGFKGFYQK